MYDTYIMRRTQIYLEEKQDARLAKRAAASGVTKSTLIRRAIDDFLEGPPDDAVRVRRFRAAVDEVAKARLQLTDGRSYVESIRAADERRQREIERRRR
jgi:predicted DNA-binding protein